MGLRDPMLDITFYTFLDKEATNLDIRHYWSPLYFTLSGSKRRWFVFKDLRLSFYAHIPTSSKHFHHRILRLDFLSRGWLAILSPRIFVEWFHGYAQNLRFYNKKNNDVRFGLKFDLDELWIGGKDVGKIND